MMDRVQTSNLADGDSDLEVRISLDETVLMCIPFIFSHQFLLRLTQRFLPWRLSSDGKLFDI